MNIIPFIVFVLVFRCFIRDMFPTGSEILMQENGNLVLLTENKEIFTGIAIRLAGNTSGFTPGKKFNHRVVKLFKYKFTLSLCRME